MSGNFFSRGSISSQHTQFHMVGVIPLGTPNTDLPVFLRGIDTTEDTYFMLCANHFKDGLGNEKQRVFWSCDPTDFIINYNSNSLNQGVVNLMLDSKKGNDSYSFKFLTSKKNSIYSLNQYFDNNLTTNPIDIEMNNNSPAKFQISQNRYNLRTDQIYVSIPYELTEYQELYSTNTDEKFKWCFRKFYSGSQTVKNNIVIDGNSSYTSTSLINYTTASNLRPFIETNVPKINFTNTDVYAITLHPTANYFSIPKTGTNGWGTTSHLFDLIATSNGIITFTENSTPTNTYTFKFNSRNTDSAEKMLFHYEILPNTFFGTTNFFTFGSTKNCNITYEIRNEPYGFDNVTNNSPKKVSDWFKIYFIPSTGSAIFPGNYTLDKSEIYPIINLMPSGYTTLNIYNPNDGQNSNNSSDINNSFKQFFYRQFSTFFMLYAILGGSFNGFWTTQSEDGYPGIAINPATNDLASSTIFTWTRHVEAYHDFMYNYCENFESCGYCFGNGIESQTCVPHDNSKKSAINSSFGNPVNPVFLSAPKDDTGIKYPDNNNQEYLGLIILGVIFGVLMLIIIIVLLYFNFRNYYKPKKTKEKNTYYNPVFNRK